MISWMVKHIEIGNRLTVDDTPSPSPETVLSTPCPAPATVCPVPAATDEAVPLTSPRRIALAVCFPVLAKFPAAPVAVPPTFFAAPPAVPVTPDAAPVAVFVAPPTAWLARLVTGAALPPVALFSCPTLNQQPTSSAVLDLLPSNAL